MTSKNQLIELTYDDELVIAAEKLFEEGCVVDVSILAGNLFVAKVSDGKMYEIEIQSPFAKKQKASCECSFFASNNICKHVIATLFKIREIDRKKAELKNSPEKNKTPRKSSTLNIAQILEQITYKDLQEFVKSYARNDKKMATQLKVHFARKIDLVDNADKYKNILNALVRPNTGEQSRASSSDIRAIIHVLEDFGDQINDCIALGQYREAFDIFSSAFAKLCYVRHYYSYHSEQLSKLNQSYHGMIDYFLTEKIPPDLRKELIAFLIDMCNRSYYHFDDVRYNIINFLIPAYPKSQKDQLQTLVANLLTDKNNQQKINTLVMWLKLADKYSRKEIDFLAPHAVHHIEIIDLLLAENLEHIALSMLESMHHSKKINREVVNRLVFLYVRTQNYEQLRVVAQMAYFHTGDVKYIEVLKRELNDDNYREMILNMQDQLADSKANPNLLLKLYKKEENWAGIILYLDKLNDFELIKEYDTILYKYERKALTELYIYMIRHYLDTYIGDFADQFMESLKVHFKKQHLDALLISVLAMLKEKYEHRPRVIEIFS